MDGVRTLQKISVSETISSFFEEMIFGKIVQTLLLTGRIALENAWFFFITFQYNADYRATEPKINL